MTTSSAAAAALGNTAVPAQQAAAATTAAAAKRLKELAETLETQGPASAHHVSSSLQQMAQQLLHLQQPAAAAAAVAAGHATDASLPGSAPTAAAAAAASGQEAGPSAAAAASPAAADVGALERSYAAPAVPGAGDTDELAALQPLSKRQRKAARAAQPRVFDFSKYEQRTVVLQLMYVGWSYHGFARQSDTDNTIEGLLFPALKHTKLIAQEADSSSLAYSRCGRTDKGVSALGQVLCLKLRSAARAGQPLPAPEQELDYPAIINRALPDTIRVLGWADSPNADFDARFSCASREYKYYIVQEGSLDVQAMRQAAQHLLGEHDFRHFCKADVLQVKNFIRRVLDVSLEPVGTSCPGMTVLALYLKGTAFLWHQVRNIAAVLLMVGRGLEKPGIVQQLLDMQQVPCKPQYNMAAEEPLLLYRCTFHDLQQWHCSPTALARNLAAVNAQLQQHLVGAALTSAIYEQLQQQWQQQQQQQQQLQQAQGSSIQQPQAHPAAAAAVAAGQQGSVGSGGGEGRWVVPPPPHLPLLKRAREPSMEERFIKCGISLDLLNQPGTAAMRKLEAGLL